MFKLKQWGQTTYNCRHFAWIFTCSQQIAWVIFVLYMILFGLYLFCTIWF